MSSLLQELGYRLDCDILSEQFKVGVHCEPIPPLYRVFEALSPYLVLAYQQGQDGLPLGELFPFLVPIGMEETLNAQCKTRTELLYGENQ